MPYNPDFRFAGIGWVDHNEVRKVWLKLLRELRVRHDYHVLVKSHAGVEFLATGLGQARPDDAQDDLRLTQLLSSFRVKKSWDALASVCWRHVHRKAIYGS